MSRSPIPRVLSTFRRRRVRSLLMGGQACILYGAAEFSRDVDFTVAVSAGNLARLRAALVDLGAEPVYVPPLSAGVLRKGHACHFRCLAPGLRCLRIDILSRMRGVDPFGKLWRRRRVMTLPGVGRIPVLSLPDLVQAKKTQRDRDWPMIRRLVEADVARADRRVQGSRIHFWLRECRTPEMLVSLAVRFPRQAEAIATHRPAVREAMRGKVAATASRLQEEEARERGRDRRYWKPLRLELERWRRERVMTKSTSRPL